MPLKVSGFLKKSKTWYWQDDFIHFLFHHAEWHSETLRHWGWVVSFLRTQFRESFERTASGEDAFNLISLFMLPFLLPSHLLSLGNEKLFFFFVITWLACLGEDGKVLSSLRLIQYFETHEFLFLCVCGKALSMTDVRWCAMMFSGVFRTVMFVKDFHVNHNLQHTSNTTPSFSLDKQTHWIWIFDGKHH